MKKQVEYLQRLFYDVWNDFGNVYLLVKYSDKTSIGKRGFTEEEQKRGLVLVFNNKTNNKLEWDSEGNLSCILAFGARKEDVFIHHDDMLGLFSPEAGIQYVRSEIGKEQDARPDKSGGAADGRQVVSISSFRKKKTTPRS